MNAQELDNYSEAYNKGVLSGQRHTEPAPATREFMDTMKDAIREIKDSLKNNSTEHQIMQKCLGGFVPQEKCDKNTSHLMDKIDDLTKQVLELPEKLMEKLDQKYASKRTEIMLYGVLAFIGVTLLGIIGYLLDKYVIR